MKPIINGTERLTPEQIAERARKERRRELERKPVLTLAERIERLELLAGIGGGS